MNDYRLDAALKGLSKYTPKAPDETVERMVKTVNALNAERQRRAGLAGMNVRGAELEKQNAQRQKQKEELTPRIKNPGIKK